MKEYKDKKLYVLIDGKFKKINNNFLFNIIDYHILGNDNIAFKPVTYRMAEINDSYKVIVTKEDKNKTYIFAYCMLPKTLPIDIELVRSLVAPHVSQNYHLTEK